MIATSNEAVVVTNERGMCKKRQCKEEKENGPHGEGREG
jgi:hypothetical protein